MSHPPKANIRETMTEIQTAADLHRITGYSIVREVGRGGIATVYLAVQKSLQREVALKIMSPALANDPNFTQRFLHEGLTIARLNHPGIVTIHDISVDGHQHYIAMELLKGGSLKQRIGGGIPPEDSLDILHQVASALSYAHESGVIHRDVKPENIMFRDPGASEAVLTDFGIAKTGAQQSNITRAGLVVGTPRYMSPEQAEGLGATERSDIYALGVILYEMLTGRPPYEAAESVAVLYSHLHDPIPELPARCRAMQPLLEDLMAKDPNERIPDCPSLLERIEEQAESMGVLPEVVVGTPAHRPAAGRQSATPSPRGLSSILAWGGGTVAVLLVVSTMTWEFTRPRPPDRSDDYALPQGEPPRIAAPTKVDLTAGSVTVPSEEPAPAASPENGVDIAALLQMAEQQVQQDRLSTPPDDNALDTYNVILKIQPGNAEAEQGLQRIASRYEQLARRMLDESNPYGAEAFVSNGLIAWPGHAGLAALRDEIDTLIAEVQGEGQGKYAESIRSYIVAAEAGNAEVQFQLALALANGDGGARNGHAALEWFEKAARQGHVKAQYNLALGRLFGPVPEPQSAGPWMKSAADAEFRPAYRVLGWMYTTGTGLKRSAGDAVIWSAKGTKWAKPPKQDDVVASWQDAFEDAYSESIVKAREEKMTENEGLK